MAGVADETIDVADFPGPGLTPLDIDAALDVLPPGPIRPGRSPRSVPTAGMLGPRGWRFDSIPVMERGREHHADGRHEQDEPEQGLQRVLVHEREESRPEKDAGDRAATHEQREDRDTTGDVTEPPIRELPRGDGRDRGEEADGPGRLHRHGEEVHQGGIRISPPAMPIRPAATPMTMPARNPSVPPRRRDGPTARPPSRATWSGSTAILERLPQDVRAWMMTAPVLACLMTVFALTAFVSVVTGGTSLVTVPVLMQFGIDPHVAVATNMLTLIFLSLGGIVPFLKRELVPRKRLPALIGLTLVGSTLGALLVLAVPAGAMPVVVGVAMIAVAIFSMARSSASMAGSSAAAMSPC